MNIHSACPIFGNVKGAFPTSFHTRAHCCCCHAVNCTGQFAQLFKFVLRHVTFYNIKLAARCSWWKTQINYNSVKDARPLLPFTLRKLPSTLTQRSYCAYEVISNISFARLRRGSLSLNMCWQLQRSSTAIDLLYPTLQGRAWKVWCPQAAMTSCGAPWYASQGAKSHAELCLAAVALSGRAPQTLREKEKACECRLIGLLECKSSLCNKKKKKKRSESLVFIWTLYANAEFPLNDERFGPFGRFGNFC